MGGRGNGGSGGSRGAGRGGIKNISGVSEKAIELFKEGVSGVATYGVGKVVINSNSETSNFGTKSAGSVVDRALEKELTNLATENGYAVSFQTVNSSTTRSQRTKTDALNRYVTKKKDRVANFYKLP